MSFLGRFQPLWSIEKFPDSSQAFNKLISKLQSFQESYKTVR